MAIKNADQIAAALRPAVQANNASIAPSNRRTVYLGDGQGNTQPPSENRVSPREVYVRSSLDQNDRGTAILDSAAPIPIDALDGFYNTPVIIANKPGSDYQYVIELADSTGTTLPAGASPIEAMIRQAAFNSQDRIVLYRIAPSLSGGLSINIDLGVYAIAYSTGGGSYAFGQTDDLDLSDPTNAETYNPVSVDLASGEHRLVGIAFNPRTGSYIAIAGTAVTAVGTLPSSESRSEFSPDDFAAIDFTGYYACGYVYQYYGQTEYIEDDCMRQYDPRQIANPNGIERWGTTDVAGSYTLLPRDSALLVDTTAARAIALQAASTYPYGLAYLIKDSTGSAASNSITITPDGSETIDGAASLTIDIDYGAVLILPVEGGWVTFAAGSTTPPSSGTVTSVGVSTDASYLTVGSSPVTTAGTITVNKTTGLTANQVVATPDGAPGTADLRALVAADIPNLSASKITSGQLAVARGGSGADLSATSGLLKQATSGANFSSATAGTDYTSPTGTENLSNKTITASSLIATALSILIGGFKAIFTHANTADRTYTLPDASGTVALTSDIPSAITALTGDVTATGPGSVAATLATVNSNVGTFSGPTSITVNGKGLITAISTVLLNLATQVTGKLALANLATGATVGQALLAGATDPAFGALNLAGTSTVSGLLGVANGGSGADLSATSGVVYQATTGAAFTTLATTGTSDVVRSGSPTITTPTIADLSNMTHSHQNAAGGGTLDGAAIAAGTVAAARLGTMTGDSGSGGVKGAAPAPAAGDAAAGKFLKADATWAVPSGGSTTITDVVGGRLTPTSGTPYETAAVSGVSSIYYTPYTSNQITLWDGSAWTQYTFSEITITVPSTIFRIFDIFAYQSSGTVTIELVNWNQTTGTITGATNATPVVVTSNSHGLTTSDLIGVTSMAGLTSLNGKLWTLSATATNTFTPASSAGNGAYTSGGTWYKMNNTRATALAYSDGRLIKSGDKTRRFVGVGCTTGTSGQLDFTLTRRWIYNQYNQKPIKVFVGESASAYIYGSSWRQANASQANQIEVLLGNTQYARIVRHGYNLMTPTSSPIVAYGIGYNTTSSNSADSLQQNNSNYTLNGQLMYNKDTAAGMSIFTSLEAFISGGANNITWGGSTALNNIQGDLWL